MGISAKPRPCGAGRVWATRIGNTIELITAEDTPKKRISRLTQTIVGKKLTVEYVVEAPGFKYVEKPFKRKVVMEQISFEGGKVLGYVGYKGFSAKFKIPLDRNDLKELTPEQAEKVFKMKLDEAEAEVQDEE